MGFLGECVSDFVRKHFEGTLIAGGGYSIEEAEERLKSKKCDLVFFGRSILANSRFVEIVQQNEPLAPFDPAMIAAPLPSDNFRAKKKPRIFKILGFVKQLNIFGVYCLMALAMLSSAWLDALTTAVDISESWERLFITICISNMSQMLN